VARTWTPDVVRRVAELAQLDLDESDVALFTTQLEDILAYAELVQEVDTSGVAPTVHPPGSGAGGREDASAPSLDRTLALGQAPDASIDAGLFRVPKVIDR
jgi:aspartyl-tRNA(Asn)/glutamyl-tRNA(Gln) amidotransferase subunit C